MPKKNAFHIVYHTILRQITSLFNNNQIFILLKATILSYWTTQADFDFLNLVNFFLEQLIFIISILQPLGSISKHKTAMKIELQRRGPGQRI
jgi:hypothetical protein